MCGIAGFWQPRLSQQDKLRDTALGMARTLQHRGPDDEGTWTHPEAGLGLCFRRLSIMDLSSAGHQPMVSSCGRYVMVFNGEIYNFAEFKKELVTSGHAFRGSSDSEVLLEAMAKWGPRELIGRLNGMFAFALWDRLDRKLTLARDHLGIKPLYYGWAGDSFIFGSELKALLAFPGFSREVDRSALGLLLQFNYIPAPHCIWRNCYKLPPGHLLVLESAFSRPQPEAFWSIDQLVNDVGIGKAESSVSEAVAALDRLLRDAVRLQMVADVPLGAFLSGGIDSSTVVALMQSQSARKVKTFTIGFRENAFDEGAHARRISDHLGTDHTELVVTPTDALGAIPLLSAIYDEPFADSSQIPTFLVSQLTKKHVTVALSGDGGDELFAGYSHYQNVNRLWALTRSIPRPLRSLIGESLGKMSEPVFVDSPTGWQKFLGRSGFDSTCRHRTRRLGECLTAKNASTFYQGRVSRWSDVSAVVPGAEEPPLPFAAPGREPPGWSALDSMAYFDSLNYLPENVLTKVDRASMAVSLEVRVPLLDYRLVEFSAKLPLNLKVRKNSGKWLLREVLHRYVPRELFDRPKMGFRLPLADWMRGSLRPWIDELLRPVELEQDGLLRSRPIQTKWSEHLQGRRDWSRHLWSVTMFQAWKRNWM